MKRKATFLFCLIFLLTSIFTACAQPKETNKEVGSTGTTSEETKEKEEPITFTVFAPHPSAIEDLETNNFTQHMEEVTGIHVEWQTVPSQGLKEKRNLLLASGDYPDIFLGASLTREEEMLYGSQGVLVPLNELIADNAPNTNKLFEQIDWLKKVITTPSGDIYTLPQINECYHCTRSQKMWINQQWLDNLNLEMPKTTEEFTNVLRAFRDQDPNGNNKQDEIPMTGAIKTWHADLPDFLMCSFIYCDGDSESYRVQINEGKVELIADKPEFRKGLKYLNGLYNEGLIDPSAFTQTREQLKQVGENPEAEVIGVSAGGWFGIFTSLGGERHKNYKVIPPLKGPEGVQLTGYYPFGFSGGQFAITNKNKHPEEAMKWVDYLMSEEGTRLSCEGREGKEWRRAEASEKGINGKPAKWKRTITYGEVQNICWMSLGSPAAVTSDYRLSEVAADDPYSAEGFETRLFQETQKYEGFEPKEVLPPLYMEAELIGEMAQLKAPITEYIKESMAQFIIGDLDIEKDWDSYVNGLKNLGAERYVEILQQSYDASVFSK